MKKILLYLTVISATISMAAADIDLKLAGNFGVGLKEGLTIIKQQLGLITLKMEVMKIKKFLSKR